MVLDLTHMSNFQPLEVVDRGSETQPKVVENLNTLIQQGTGLHAYLANTDVFSGSDDVQY